MIQAASEFFKGLTGGNEYLMLLLMSAIPMIELRGAVVFMSGLFVDSASRFADMYAGLWCCIAGGTVVILPLMMITIPLLNRLKQSRRLSKFAKKMEASLSDRASGVPKSASSKEPKGRKHKPHGFASPNNSSSKGHTNDISKNSASNSGLKNKSGASSKKKAGEWEKFAGLYAFVAVPLPLTGAWTGSLIGGFLGLPLWKASLAVLCGNITAGHILLLISYFLPAGYADIFMYAFLALIAATALSMYFSRLIRKKR